MILLKAQPSEAQKEAGNYRKKHVRFRGLNIAIENPKGSIRSGIDRGGKQWAIKMHAGYGYVNGSMGVDGDQVDVFIGPDKESDMVYVITTMAPPYFIKPDENKCMLGYASQAEAKAAFLAHYDSDKFFGGIVAMPMDEFKAKVLATKDRPKFIKAHVSGYRRDDGAYVAPHEDKRPARKKRYPNKGNERDFEIFSALKDGRREALRELSGAKLDAMLVSMHASNKHLRDLVDKSSQPSAGLADATLEALSGMDPKRLVRLHGWHDLIGLLRSVLRDFSIQLRKAGAHKQADWLQWKIGEWTDDDIGRLLLRADARGKTMTKGMDMNHIDRLLGDFGGATPRVLFLKGYVRAHTRVVNGKTVAVPSYHTGVIAAPKPGKRVKDDLTGDLFADQAPAKNPMGPSPYSEAAMRQPEKHTDDLFRSKPKEVETPDLEKFGEVNITSVGSENIYFEKDGKEYFSKIWTGSDRFKHGKHDFKDSLSPSERGVKFSVPSFGIAHANTAVSPDGKSRPMTKEEMLDYDDGIKKRADDAIHTMPKQEAIAEHERLVDVLNSPSHADDKVEAKKQAEELAEMKAPTNLGAKVTPQVLSDAKAGLFIKIAADGIEKLRIDDVGRVLSETPSHYRLSMASYIKTKRYDLREEVDEIIEELAEDEHLRSKGYGAADSGGGSPPVQSSSRGDTWGGYPSQEEYERAGAEKTKRDAKWVQETGSAYKRILAKSSSFQDGSERQPGSFGLGSSSKNDSARILFFKSHIDGYTRKDGVTVKPHEDKRTKKVEKDWRDEENWHTRAMGRMKTLSDDSLHYIIKDANEAARNMEQMNPNSEKAGRYRDEAHYASMELRKRQEKHKVA